MTQEEKFKNHALNEIREAWGDADQNIEDQMADLRAEGQRCDSDLIAENWYKIAKETKKYWLDRAKSMNAGQDTIKAIANA